MELKSEVKIILTIGWQNQHYVLILLQLDLEKVIVYDGIGRIPLDHWCSNVSYVLHRCGLANKSSSFINDI